MESIGWGIERRPATPADEALLFEVFCTTRADQVASLPDPSLARHFLRIQYTAQERKFRSRFPDHERWVVLHDGAPAGRFLLHRTPDTISIVDLTLLPEFRSQGVGSRLTQHVLDEAADQGKAVTLRVPNHNLRAVSLYEGIGFTLVRSDDEDSYFEWTPEAARPGSHPRGTVSSHSVP